MVASPRPAFRLVGSRSQPDRASCLRCPAGDRRGHSCGQDRLHRRLSKALKRSRHRGSILRRAGSHLRRALVGVSVRDRLTSRVEPTLEIEARARRNGEKPADFPARLPGALTAKGGAGEFFAILPAGYLEPIRTWCTPRPKPPAWRSTSPIPGSSGPSVRRPRSSDEEIATSVSRPVASRRLCLSSLGREGT